MKTTVANLSFAIEMYGNREFLLSIRFSGIMLLLIRLKSRADPITRESIISLVHFALHFHEEMHMSPSSIRP
jgi:hypothetical protein